MNFGNIMYVALVLILCLPIVTVFITQVIDNVKDLASWLTEK